MEQELFEIALDIQDPLFVSEIMLDPKVGELNIHLDFKAGARFGCSNCGTADLPVHDTTIKTWRHLNFFQYKCFIHFRTPRTICPKCGKQLWIPSWGRKKSGFTLMFEAFIIALARLMPRKQIGEMVDEYDTRVWRIIRFYTKKAYKKKDFSKTTKIACDETSTRKGHNYITVFADTVESEVIFATKGRDSGTIKAFAEELKHHNASPEQIKEIAIDMSPAFIAGVAEYLEYSEITYDKFHVIQALNKALDEVRREEQKLNPLLKNTRFVWLKNENNLSVYDLKRLETLRYENLKTARVYQMKLTFQDIYRSIKDPIRAELAIKKWLSWAVRSRLDPVKRFARMVKSHMNGILRYFTSRLTSGVIEGLNSRIQDIKRRAKGFRNVQNFISLIYLELGNLDFTLTPSK